jgi:transcriptional regulator with XRE-family HTH domain
MGRPLKNAEHPIARLRRQLSTLNHQVTRQELARRTGIPEPSIRDLETGRYKLTRDVAVRIAYATGVDPRSLLAGDDPLLDFRRQPFSKDSPRLPESLLWRPETQEVREQLFLAAWDAAREKNLSLLLAFGFEDWLLATFKALGLEALLIEKLTDRLHLFDPGLVPDEFCPKNNRFAKRWDTLAKEIEEECSRIVRQDMVENPDYYKRVGPQPLSEEFLNKMNDFRVEARRRLRQRKEEEAKALKPKPLSEKRPRSPSRPAA